MTAPAAHPATALAAALPDPPEPAEASAQAVLLDISRSVKRLRLPRQTGIDRVETAYLEWCLSRAPGAWLLAGIGGRQYLVPPDRAATLAAELAGIAEDDRGLSSVDSGTEDAMGPDAATVPELGLAPRRAVPLDLRARLAFWRDRRLRMGEAAVRRAAVASAPTALLPLRRMLERLPMGTIALNVGHDNLSMTLAGALRGAGLRLVVMIHDLIPITHPEYSRPVPAARFAERLEAALMADLMLTNSRATAAAVSAHAAAHDHRLPPLRVLPLGIALPDPPDHPPAAGAAAKGGAGHFVMLGTIEGRKNHLLLLALWRGLSDAGPPGEAPHLHIIGRRGWAAGQVFDMLDRAPMMGRTVFEHADLDDASAMALVSGARALLLPSFVEGFGLPLGEALAAGVPVIASNLPALREVGGDVPDWLDPLDGNGWLDAIRDYATPGSSRRAEQLARLETWRRPTWRAHFTRLEALLAEEAVLRPAPQG